MLKGRVKALKSDGSVTDGSANRVIIEADIGDLLFVEATRDSVYIYGQWMGKADLRYVLNIGKKVTKFKLKDTISPFIIAFFHTYDLNKPHFSTFRQRGLL